MWKDGVVDKYGQNTITTNMIEQYLVRIIQN